MAVVAGDPVDSVRLGVPPVVLTVTLSLNVTVIGMTTPTPYVLFAVPEDTPVTVGPVVSMTIALFAPSDPAVFGANKVSVALFAAPVAMTSVMEPPLSDSALVDV